MVERQVRVFLPHEYFVMYERVGFLYRVTFVIDHNMPTQRRWFAFRTSAVAKFNWATQFAEFITRSDTEKEVERDAAST